MKNLFRTATFSLIAFAFAIGQGCVSVSYSGKSYEPTTNVEVIQKQKDIPAGYEIMGKAAATAPEAEGSRQDLEKKLVQKAKDKGADAVMITLYELVKTGEERVDQLMDTSPVNTGWGMDVDTEGDIRQLNSSNTSPNSGARVETPVYQAVMKAVFLKKTEKKANP